MSHIVKHLSEHTFYCLLYDTDSLPPHTKVMLNARRFVVMIYTRKHQVRKVKWRDAGNVGFRTQVTAQRRQGKADSLNMSEEWEREKHRYRERERERERGRDRGRSKERRGERGDRSRGDLALISVRTTGWLWVEKEMMEANKVLHFVPSGKIHMHSHTYTHAHICTCSCAVTTEYLRDYLKFETVC